MLNKVNFHHSVVFWMSAKAFVRKNCARSKYICSVRATRAQRQDTMNGSSVSLWAIYHYLDLRFNLYSHQIPPPNNDSREVGKVNKGKRSPRSTFVIDNPRRGDRITRKQIDELRYFMKLRASRSSDKLLIAAAFLSISDDRHDDVDELFESRRSFLMQIQLRSIFDRFR